MDKIENLLTAENLAQSSDYGFDVALTTDDVADIVEFLSFSHYALYCSVFLNMTRAECDEEIRGCGLTDDCPRGQECVNDSSESKGFSCIGKDPT